MGLFDELVWEPKLPLPENMGEHANHKFDGSTIWQTKSFGMGLEKYKMDKDGQFWKEKSAAYCNDRPGQESWWVKDDYFGVLVFYIFLQGKQDDLFLEYKCKIDDGKLRSVDLSEDTFLQQA